MASVAFHTWSAYFLCKEDIRVCFLSKPEQGCVDVCRADCDALDERFDKRLQPQAARSLWRELLAEGFTPAT